MILHGDSRRTLIEWAGGKVNKALIAKRDCVVGDHYHRNKEERFLLLKGEGYIQVGEEALHCYAPFEFTVPPLTYHKFELSEGSILLCVASEEFDPQDEIKGTPSNV